MPWLEPHTAIRAIGKMRDITGASAYALTVMSKQLKSAAMAPRGST